MDEIRKIKDLVQLAYKIEENTSELNWSMERLEYFTKELFKYSKFKVGNKVCLKETPEITDKVRWGWLGHKDVLVKGAIGIIKEVDHYGGKFRYALEIIKHHGTFTFNEECLKKCSK